MVIEEIAAGTIVSLTAECGVTSEDRCNDGVDDDAGDPSPVDPTACGDADEDGVVDASDGCPFAPEDLDGYLDEDACPELDNDDDGIADKIDSCPLEPEDFDDVPLPVLLPAFMLSELKTAFLIGFQIYLPFVILDIVIASVTISMGMLMLPPVLISLPFKILLFVMVDGWHLLISSMIGSFR